MKLLLILLLFPVICFGQKKDSLEYGIITSGYGLTIDSSDNYYLSLREQTSDTSKVIMLVCYPDSSEVVVWEWGKKEWGYYDNNVYWMFGYAITIFHEGETDDGHHWPRETEIYLDENKKPLPKSVIVWQTKKINQ